MFIPYNPYLMRDPLVVSRNRLLLRIADPESEPVTMSDAKLYLRIDDNNNDALVSDLIIAARIIAENWLRKSLITQTWKLAYDYGVPPVVGLPMGPINAISSVIIFNRDGTNTTLDPSTYYLNAAQNALVLNSVLISFQIEITYTAGYGDATTVPKPIKQGMLAHIAAMYDSRGEAGETDLPEQTVALYMPFREVRL